MSSPVSQFQTTGNHYNVGSLNINATDSDVNMQVSDQEQGAQTRSQCNEILTSLVKRNLDQYQPTNPKSGWEKAIKLPISHDLKSKIMENNFDEIDSTTIVTNYFNQQHQYLKHQQLDLIKNWSNLFFFPLSVEDDKGKPNSFFLSYPRDYKSYVEENALIPENYKIAPCGTSSSSDLQKWYTDLHAFLNKELEIRQKDNDHLDSLPETGDDIEERYQRNLEKITFLKGALENL